MIITFATVIFVFLFLFSAVQKNIFFILYGASMILSAYYCETYLHWHPTIFGKTTFMLFLFFHIIYINVYTFAAYGRDKYCAIRKKWRIPEIQLHTMELLGGIIGAVAGQKFFHHKNKKKNYMATFLATIVIQIGLILYIMKNLHLF